MNNYSIIIREIKKTIQKLISIGLADEFNYPSIKSYRGINYISWGNTNDLSIVLKNIPYKEIYNELEKNDHYNIKLADGGLIQFLYKFDHEGLLSHRLALFSSPHLEHYQNNPEVYEEDELYADIINKNIVAFPIRFDYHRNEISSEFEHPLSHASLGQYSNCRIPVSGPVPPIVFINFILKNFYSTSFRNLLEQPLSNSCNTFNTIREQEIANMHFNFEL